MTSVAKRVSMALACVLLPVMGFAQEATLGGTVTDTTGGVLPGTVITVVHDATGNTFQGVADERGAFRIPVRVGTLTVTAELQGFGTGTRKVQLLVGQAAAINFQLSPSSVQETVTVTSEAPLIEVTQSKLGGNIDPRQMQELPVNGRNWMDLATLAPGARTNESAETGPVAGTSRRDFQVNIDGQQVTSNLVPTTSQPRVSRDAIAEFQFVASRFDATQGRSSGVQVNAVTKSGTNTPSGTFSGYFRHDAFNAADFIQDEVLPYSNQQISATFGGPLIRDRLHFFANYEYEREPRTDAFNTPFPAFNFDLSGTRRGDLAGLRVDYQVSNNTRWMFRSNLFKDDQPYDMAGGATNHPASTALNKTRMKELFSSLTQVLGNRAVNEARVGWHSLYYTNTNYTTWDNHPARAQGITTGSPRITFRGFAISGNANQPQRLGHDIYSVRDDFSYSFSKGGSHALRMGGEFLFYDHALLNCRNCMGVIDAQGGPVPANIESLFPVWDDPDTWNLAALSPIVRSYQIGIGSFKYNQKRKVGAAWVQDDWRLNDRLTLNLGLRYDVALGVWANAMAIEPWLEANRPDDTNNIGPRLGFAYTLTPQTVLRGGFGFYYGEVLNNISSFTLSFANIVNVELLNDGRPDFAVNPFNGPMPSYEEAQRRLCRNAPGPGCLRPSANTIAPPPEFAHVPYSYQTSVGVQRQIGDVMALEVDYAYNGGRHERFGQGHNPVMNFNLTYDPATGINYPFTNIARRADPNWGVVQMEIMERRSNYHGLVTGFTRRLRDRWQASGTYTLSWLYDGDPLPLSGLQQVTFPVPNDLGGQYGLATTDQRHRAVFNGIWEAGWGFQLSGLYFYGSGMRFATTYGGDFRQTGRTGGRLRPDGTIVPRNGFVGDQIHRVDMRLQRRFRLGGNASIDGMLEVFNLFNRENFGSYTTVESNANYGRPEANVNVAYQPRMLQLGFRLAF